MTDEEVRVDEEEDTGDANEMLYEAVQRKDVELARQALAAGADPNYARYNWPVLMDAARNGDVEMVKLLLAHGADPSAEDTAMIKGTSALSLAQDNGHHEIAVMLVEAGADTSARGDGMLTAYDRAVVSGDFELADMLYRDIDDTSEDPLGRTPLDIVLAEGGNLDAIKYLLDRAGISYDEDALADMSEEEIQQLVAVGGADMEDQVEEEEEQEAEQEKDESSQ